MKRLIWITPQDFCQRVLVSLIPPINSKYKKIYVDILGPSIGSVLLIVLLNYGVALKQSVDIISPLKTVLFYIIVMPLICLVFNKIGQSLLSFMEIVSLIGYSQYSYIVILLISHVLYVGDSDLVFFLSLIIFGGLSTLRIVLLQLPLIPFPGARLLVCSTVSIIHILFVIYLHFTYMHPTFVYGTHYV